MIEFARTTTSLLNDADELRIFLISVFKSLALTVICISMNLLGVFASQMADNILFLDFCGTIVVAMIYGPIHAALVGIITTYVGQIVFNNLSSGASLYSLDYYFLFAPVHMAIGAVVFFVPRLLRGKWSFDFFCGNERKYPAGRLLISMILLALLTSLASSLTVVAIMSIDGLGVTCGELLQTETSSNSRQLCEFAQLLFEDIKNETNYYFLKLLIFKFIIGLPDHLVCFPSAVVFVAFILDARRYKMSRKFSQTLITNHPAVGTVYFLLFLGFVFLYTLNVYTHVTNNHAGNNHTGIWATFLVWSFYNTFIICVSFFVVTGRFNVWWFKPGHKHEIRRRYTYKKLNVSMKDAYEDSMKFAILYSTIVYFILTWLKRTDGVDDIYETFKKKLIGALGVVVIISLIRYLVLIVARVGRYLGEPWRRERQKQPEGSKDNQTSIV